MPEIEAEPAHLIGAIERASTLFSGRGISLMDRRGRLAEKRSYPQVFESAQAAARRLLRRGVEAGDRVMICLPTSWSWIESWLGTVLAGGVPVAVSPPEGLGSPSGVLGRVDGVAERIEASLLVCSDRLLAPIHEHRLETLSTIATPIGELEKLPPGASLPRLDPAPEEVAFLQLTSGSTGVPRAVMIPHRAAVHNTIACGEAIGRPLGRPVWEWEPSSLVSWLPLYHDMGLVGGILFSMMNGLDLVLVSPRTFLGKPRTWLELLSRVGPAISPAPNFGYQLCLERIAEEERAGHRPQQRDPHCSRTEHHAARARVDRRGGG